MQLPNQDEIKAIMSDPEAWLRKHGHDTTVFKDLAKKTAQDSSGIVMDYDAIEKEGDWNSLAGQIVGRELSS